MSGAVSPVTGRPYGLASVCRAWRVSRATVYRHRAASRLEPPRRPARGFAPATLGLDNPLESRLPRPSKPRSPAVQRRPLRQDTHNESPLDRQRPHTSSYPG